MKTLIIGAGIVGANIAVRLVEEGHDVTLIDPDAGRLKEVTDQLDAGGLCGHGSHPRTLKLAGIESVDMVIAVTDSDEVNMMACMNASLLGQTEAIRVARVREPSYREAYEQEEDRGFIDLILNPEQVTAEKVLALLRYPGVTEVLEFADGKVSLVGTHVKPDSPLAGLRLQELADRFPTWEFLVVAIERNGELIVPRGHDVILPGDEILLALRSEEIEGVLEDVGIAISPISRVMIVGGTPLARFLAQGLEARHIKPKLIESDREVAADLAQHLPDTVVIHGSPTDGVLLLEENVGEMQAVITCSAREEVNLMAALLARRMGAGRIISTTNQTDYKPVMRAVGVDVCLSPRLSAVSAILRFVRQGHVVSTQAIGSDEHAEALEFEVDSDSPAVRKSLQSWRSPTGALVAALVRDGLVLIPRGQTIIETGDRLLVVTRQDVVHDVEALLQHPAARG